MRYFNNGMLIDIIQRMANCKMQLAILFFILVLKIKHNTLTICTTYVI